MYHKDCNLEIILLLLKKYIYLSLTNSLIYLELSK